MPQIQSKVFLIVSALEQSFHFELLVVLTFLASGNFRLLLISFAGSLDPDQDQQNPIQY